MFGSLEISFIAAKKDAGIEVYFKGTVSRFGACPYYIFACARFIARPAFSLFMNQSEASCLISHANSHEIINRGINPTGQN